MKKFITKAMIDYFHGDVRRINHALKVTAFAELIGELEGLSATEQETLELAALLHDIGIHMAEQKHHSTAGSFQELEGPPIAKQLLEQYDVSAPLIERVCYLVGHHHSYHMIDGVDFQILVEADFLVNIDEDGLNAVSITTIVQKYFITESGRQLAASLYPLRENMQ